nr:MAG TPA: hypothetical protein [Caudoviricetes sp.]
MGFFLIGSIFLIFMRLSPFFFGSLYITLNAIKVQ